MFSEKQLQLSPAQLLREVLGECKLRNPLYSTRSFARDLNISQTLLSFLMHGKRPLTVKLATQIGMMLALNKTQSAQLVQSAIAHLPTTSKGYKKIKEASQRQKKREPAPYLNFEMERFKVISQWYHVAILDLSTSKTFQANIPWIAKRLGISQLETREAVERLVQLGFLKKERNTLKKTNERIYLATQKSESAVRQFHKQMIGLASSQLDQTEPEAFAAREISGTTMSIKMSRLAEAKKRIQEFQKELADFLAEGEGEEVYQMNVQLFPLSKKTKE